jgi:hypothetical protein
MQQILHDPAPNVLPHLRGRYHKSVVFQIGTYVFHSSNHLYEIGIITGLYHDESRLC